MKMNPDLNAAWADSITLRLQCAARRYEKARKELEMFDSMPLWARLLMGGRLYRWVLVVQHINALEEYMQVDLEVKG